MLLLILLCLLWLLLGVVIGLLATVAGAGANTDTIHRSLQSVGWMAGLGALAAFGGGWLGVWLVGRPLATAMALWIAIMCVLLAPRLYRILMPLIGE